MELGLVEKRVIRVRYRWQSEIQEFKILGFRVGDQLYQTRAPRLCVVRLKEVNVRKYKSYAKS